MDRIVRTIAFIIILILVVYAGVRFQRPKEQGPKETQKLLQEISNMPVKIISEAPSVTNVNQPKETVKKDIEVIAQNLSIPWGVAFLPTGEILVTERPGNLLKIGKDRAVIKIHGVRHVGEGGLLGLAMHPDFAQNNFLYLYLTTREGDGLTNRVERYRLEGNELRDRKIIIEKIPGAVFHDGGRIAFGPDGMLYVTTGDAQNPNLAQDRASLAGKILRLRDDGTVPQDNPFGSPVYSYGHRNPQGLAWDDQGRLWATEHGASNFDELNLIIKGANYGWPTIIGDQKRVGMQTPVIHSGSRDTWAPAGLVYLRGNLIFAGLRGESLYQAKIFPDGTVRSFEKKFEGEFGRIRAVVLGPDEDIYITTSNTDGRGDPLPGDDKLISLNQSLFTF